MRNAKTLDRKEQGTNEGKPKDQTRWRVERGSLPSMPTVLKTPWLACVSPRKILARRRQALWNQWRWAWAKWYPKLHPL